MKRGLANTFRDRYTSTRYALLSGTKVPGVEELGDAGSRLLAGEDPNLLVTDVPNSELRRLVSSAGLSQQQQEALGLHVV